MNKVIEIFNAIQQTNSLNEKKMIISQNKENEIFKKCLKFLLDGMFVTGISSKKLKKDLNQLNIFDDIQSWEDCMKYLQENNTGRDIDIKRVQNFIVSQPIEHQEFYKNMVTKKYKLGADAKLVNKVLPDLIQTFDLMLGTSIEKCKLKEKQYISLSRKLNGCRAAWVGNKFLTRQGKEYVGLDHIKYDLLKLGYENMFIDGELIYKNNERLSDSETFQIGCGIANSKSRVKEELKFIVFDIFPLDEFGIGKSKETYSVRKRTYLARLADALNTYKTENINIVELLYEGCDHSEIQKWLDYAEENDWEGIMCNLDTPYECKRTKNLIKIKKFFSCDVKCVGIEVGDGKYKGTLGAIVVEYKGNKVNVGSGFSDELRNHYWENQNEIIGRIVSVKYKEETKNKKGGTSIQFPIFECVRFDKTEPSYN